MLTIKKLHIRLFALLLMLLAGAQNSTWGATVTYHILTLPINPSVYDYHMKPEITGWRLEAVKVVAKNQTTVELPAEYKSPLATGFTYYNASDITKYSSGTPQSLFANGPVKGVLYKVTGEDTPSTADDPTPVTEGTNISGSTAEYYVIYTYNASNEIAQLDGSVKYNIRTKYKDNKEWKDRGFFALNRGRNNRPAVLPTDNVDPEMLASEDFMVAPVTGTGVSTYWKDNNNKNKEADVAGQFHFMFKFEGVDPYNIIIRTTYNRPYTYIEKNEGTNDFVYKWYKEASLFAVTTGNAYIASDEHKKYKTAYNSGNPNPTDPASDNMPGYYHGHSGAIWNSVALLPNSDKNGYVFMATRAVDGNGAIGNTIYYLKQKDNCNNLNFASGNSTDNLSIEGLYPLKKVTFKVATPFYKVSATTDHIVSAPTEWVSQYTVDNDPIETKYLPAALKRKYCNFNGDFYSDAACTNKITKFSQATIHPTEGYQVYVGYDVSASAPKFLSPSDSYTTATWYELTDAGSVQESGRKIKWDATNSVYKNNGANGEYVKESEFALVGDPYEVKVLYRKGTEDAGSNQYVTLSTYDTWDIPNDAETGSFLLRKFNDTGYWSWDAGQVSADVTYGSDQTITPNTDKNAQTITINLSGLNSSKYFKITTGGTGASQIVSVTPNANNVEKVPGTTMTVIVKLAENTSGADKTMTVTIQEYNDAEGNTAFGSASDITITQGTGSSSFAGNEVTYSTSSSTRVKVMELPTRTFTYNIVDKSGRIAIKASATQTIFSALSLASIPSIIVSPFLVGETVTFYDTFNNGSGPGTGTSRTHLSGSITETPDVAADIYVKYTTTNLINKPIKLNQEQEFNVVLNGQYVYYDGGALKTKVAPTTDELKSSAYLWKLRNRDPYAMLIDNKGARAHLSVSGDESVTMYSDAGVPGTETREKGVWVTLASIANEGVLSFTTRRSNESDGGGPYAQRFVAKASTVNGVYEVMVATGTSVDASTTYYNIGCPAENTVKIYDNAHYAHGKDELKFNLEQTIGYVYHLIDKSKHELLTLTSQNPDLALPGDYQSPLVATYHFYDPANISQEGDEYTPRTTPPATELTSLAGLNATYDTPVTTDASTWESAGEGHKLEATSHDNMIEKAKQLGSTGHYYYKVASEPITYYDVNVTKPFYNHIYVTYEANDIVTFNTGSYMLKFLEPFAEGYHLEDGLDKLTTTKIQAVYPYCNGDGNLNIYGDDMQKEQFNGGASTRPRWIWYFDSDNSDPYHVAIRSRSTISYKSVSNPTYLTTYVVHFNQDADPNTKHVVTGGTLPGVASVEPTEYMVLGSAGNYKLMTTNEIDDGTTSERRKVTSLEQYWKTYNMLKLHVLGIAKSTDAYSDDESTWVVPDDPASYRTTIEAKGWHSYNAYANAVRWNGYNDKTDGHEKKVVENIEHWFQTFDMGNGTFDIENAEVPPVLVLLDLHGWEIMRLPLPTVNYPEGDDELAALRAYDSPMVKEYKFYSNATKATGCHKFTLRMQNGAERDQIKVNGVHYTSSSLADLPPITASGVKSGGAFNDQFVTYTVKEEYTKSYSYEFTDNGKDDYSESGTASKFLILLRSRFLRDNGASTSYFSKPIYEASNPVGGNVYDAILVPQPVTQSNVSTNVDDNKDGYIDDINLWYVQPNLNIDKEMGIKWGTSDDITAAEPLSEYGTKKKYKDITGFDPYNLQLKNADNNKFVTSHQTTTTLDNGILIGDYSGTTDMTLETEFSYADVNPLTPTGSEGYDHTNLKISNQTFMAVSDANGNLQLMPRFDHTKRVNLVNNAANSFTTLQDPVNHPKASAEDNSSMGTQTVFFVRPQVFEYKIIDNDGNESIRYKRSGDFYPAITDHFKSPLAKDFTYYTGLAEFDYPDPEHPENPIAESTVQAWDAATGNLKRTATTSTLMNSQIKLLPTAGTYEYRVGTRGSFTYYTVEVTKGLQEKQITGSFADAGLNDKDCNVIVRYDYDANADHDGDRILEGKWFTIKLNNKDVQSDGTINTADGTGVSLYADAATPTKPATIDEDDKKWQWKFLAAPADPSSDYYEAPDPYAIHLFNRYANYTTNPSEQPSPMAVGIKVPNANDGADRFALLSHAEGGYALAVAGTELYYYKFLNGANMTAPDAAEPMAATTATEASFTQKAGIFDGVKSQLLLNDDVEHHFTYKVINNGGSDYVVESPGFLAVEAMQNNDAADAHEFFPYLPYDAQTPLLRMKDYTYYGFARPNNNATPEDPSDDTYSVIPQTVLYTLYGLYDDVVWVRYGAYDMDSTEFKIPNEKAIVDSHVARGEGSHDVSMNINGELPYNIIWYNDNMMKAVDTSDPADGTYDEINKETSQDLSGSAEYVWYFTGNDPYGLKIKHKGGKYLNGSATMVAEASAPTFMLLRKSGYDYGILQKTGGSNKFTFGDDDSDGETPDTYYMDSGDPTKFIIFGLSVHDLIYHLIIAKTCTKAEETDPDLDTSKYVDIPYRTGDESTYQTSGTWTSSDVTRIYGSTQRNLTAGSPAGATYQLGETLAWGGTDHTYSHDAGSVSIGDILEVPNVFNRPNCTYEFYIQDIYGSDKTTAQDGLNNKYKGLKLKNLMSDSELIDKTVVVNIVYSFNQELATNNGMDFVRSTGDKCWYTFETQGGGTPYLAHYTNAWGLQTMTGRETRYTNDYLWTPVGDVYGFKLYNRYMIKNSDGTNKVMTYTETASEGKNLAVAEPGTGSYTTGNEIFELISGDMPGYFRVHPVVNNSGTQYYVKRDDADNNYAKLSTTPSDWTFGLDMSLMAPYYERAGYVGGLTDGGKTAYETAVNSGTIMDIQHVVFDDDNIIKFSSGYYRLHNQPGVSRIDPVRYASGYLHEIEKTAGTSSTPIPMHFYSKEGVLASFAGAEDGLGSGFTVTDATRGDIPIAPTERDPSTIFYINGSVTGNKTISEATMSTQGLNVLGNKMTTETGTTFTFIDIGGATFLIADELTPATRQYFCFDQTSNVYDIKFAHEVPTDDAKWCLQPVQKTATVGNSEMPLEIATNQGGDGHYYATFYAPFDVLLPNDTGGHTYYAYYCKTWDNAGLHPTAVPAIGTYAEGKFVPAGTPVIIRTTDETNVVTLTLPSTSPTASSITTDLKGSYLEQMLTPDSSHDVYTLGLPFTSAASIDRETGVVTAPLVESATTGVGFYINATPNKEHNALQAMWQRNNLYVLHNKIYYRATGSGGSGAKNRSDAPQYVPVIFDDLEEEMKEEDGNLMRGTAYSDKVYDMQGRVVMSGEAVLNGSWYDDVAPGVYIINGKKILKP